MIQTWTFRAEFLNTHNSTRYYIEFDLKCDLDSLWSAGQAMAKRIARKILEDDLSRKNLGSISADYALLDVVCTNRPTEVVASPLLGSKPDSTPPDDPDAAAKDTNLRPGPPTILGSASEVIPHRSLEVVDLLPSPREGYYPPTPGYPTQDADIASHESPPDHVLDPPSAYKRTEDEEHLQGL